MSSPGYYGIRLKSKRHSYYEEIPNLLLREAILGLDDTDPASEVEASEQQLRALLVQWTNGPENRQVARDDIEKIYRQLLSISHLGKGELGQVGHLSGDSGWLLCDSSGPELYVVSACTILAAALLRLIVLFDDTSSLELVYSEANNG